MSVFRREVVVLNDIFVNGTKSFHLIIEKVEYKLERRLIWRREADVGFINFFSWRNL